MIHKFNNKKKTKKIIKHKSIKNKSIKNKSIKYKLINKKKMYGGGAPKMKFGSSSPSPTKSFGASFKPYSHMSQTSQKSQNSQNKWTERAVRAGTTVPDFMIKAAATVGAVSKENAQTAIAAKQVVKAATQVAKQVSPSTYNTVKKTGAIKQLTQGNVGSAISKVLNSSGGPQKLIQSVKSNAQKITPVSGEQALKIMQGFLPPSMSVSGASSPQKNIQTVLAGLT